MFSQQFAAFVGDRVDAFTVDVLAGEEVALFEHLQRRIDRARARAEAALLLDREHDVVTMPRPIPQDAEDVVLDAAALGLAEGTATAAMMAPMELTERAARLAEDLAGLCE